MSGHSPESIYLVAMLADNLDRVNRFNALLHRSSAQNDKRFFRSQQKKVKPVIRPKPACFRKRFGKYK